MTIRFTEVSYTGINGSVDFAPIVAHTEIVIVDHETVIYRVKSQNDCNHVIEIHATSNPAANELAIQSARHRISQYDAMHALGESEHAH